MVLCPLWGGIRVILHLATEFGEYFEKVANMLQQIGFMLSSLRRFPKLYPHNDHLASAMVAVYQKIFEFCAKARKVFFDARERRIQKICIPMGLQTMTKLIWKPFKIQFGDLQDDLSTCMERIEMEVDLAEKEEAYLERQRAQQERRTQSFRWGKTQAAHSKIEEFIDEQNIVKVNQWLSPIDVEVNHLAAAKLRHSGTGRWFLESQAFMKWLEHEYRFLWINAIPGAGKTVLMSSAVEYLKENTQNAHVGLAYFYCDYKELQKQIPSKILCTLLCQLAGKNQIIFHRLQTFFQDRHKENPANSPGFDELRGNFADFVEDSYDSILLVIDALDECTQRDCIARALKTIHDSCPLVKILVSSRQEQEISAVFDHLPNFRITQKHMAPDIASFVKAEIADRIKSKRLKIRKPELQQTICDKLISKANGMFQWVKCQIEVLCTLGMDKLILKALEDLPRDLVGTYTRILQRIEREREQLESVKRLLQWLVRGTRSMSLEELSECIGMDLDEDNESMDFDAVITDPKDILHLCGSLVTVSDGGSVSLAHNTVKEFLMSDFASINMAQFYVGGDNVEAVLAKTCLVYLNYGDFITGAVSEEAKFRELLEEYKFLEYAAQSWAIHAHQCKEQNINDMILKLLCSDSEGRGNLSLWTQILTCGKTARHFVIPSRTNPIYYASFFGLPMSLRALLDGGMAYSAEDLEDDPLKAAITEGHIEVVNILLEQELEIQQSRLGRYLYIASSKGHHTLVKRLLEKGVAVDSQGGKQGTALQIAALEGHKEVVQVLLENKASTKVFNARFGTPLSAAAEKGHQGCFQLLLNAGASIHGRAGWYAYPLNSALVGKNDIIIQILLNKGANVNLTGGRHVCALMAACAVSKIEWVERLIDLGAKVNDENDKGADALHSACCARRLDVVELLLANGADVNAKGGKHRNALNAASSEGSVDIVNCLLEAGADASAFDDNYGNALQAAVLGGHQLVVKILAPRCEVNSAGGVKGTALVIAAGLGDVQMLSLLFELGIRAGPTKDIANAMVAASAKAHDDAVIALVKKGGNVDATGTYKLKTWTSLQVAANKGNVSTVAQLLALGASPALVAGSNGTALLAASDTSAHDHSELHIIDLLTNAGANVNTLLEYPCGSGGWDNALSAAVGRNNEDATRLLLSKGSNVNLTNKKVRTPLQVASQTGNNVILELLFQYGADPNLELERHQGLEGDGIITALQEAAHNGSESTIRLLVTKGARLMLDRSDSRYKSALHAASFAGQLDNVKLLIELGSDVNSNGGYYGTSLQAASFQGHTEIMGALLDAGANVNASNQGHHGTALMAAVDHDNDDNLPAVQLLLERGANPSLKGSLNYQFPLQAACWHGSDEIVNALIAAGAEINAFGGKYHSALQAAACEGQDEIMAALIGAGAQVDATGGIYGTAFAAAYREGYYVCTNLLYEHDASNRIPAGVLGSPFGAALNGACQTLINFFVKRHDADINGYLGRRLGTPLHHCIRARYYPGEDSDGELLVDLLIQNGADVNGLGPDGFGGHYGTPLNCAAAQGSTDIIIKLLDAGADLRLRGNRREWTALQLACLFEHENVVDLLLEKGADINSHGKYGTPLQAASYSGKTNLVRKFLLRGARVEECKLGRYGHALQAAVIQGHEDVAKLLIKRGADVNVAGGRFDSVLQAASMQCSKKFIDFLIRKGANVNRRGGRYHTALQAAAAAGRRKIVLALLQHGAEVNYYGGRYGSALQAACVSGKMKSVRALIDHGADPDAKGGFYGSALSAALIKNRTNIVQYLIHKAGATASTIDRRPANHNQAVYDKADQMLSAIREADGQGGVSAVGMESKDNEDDEQELDVHSQNDESSSDHDSEDIELENQNTSDTSASDDPLSDGLDKTGEIDEEAADAMSPLGWLQVECGYGGDLNGPGR